MLESRTARDHIKKKKLKKKEYPNQQANKANLNSKPELSWYGCYDT